MPEKRMPDRKRMMSKITIGYFDDTMGRGGTARYFTEVLSALDRTQFSPVFFASKPQEWHSDLRSLDVPVITVCGQDNVAESGAAQPLPAMIPVSGKTTGKRSAFRLPRKLAWCVGLSREIIGLRKMFRAHPVDLLHINVSGTDDFAPIAARLARVPRILATYHVSPAYDLENKRNGLRHRFLERQSLKSLHRAISCCHFTKQDWVQRHSIASGLMQVVHNGISMARVERRSSRAEARAQLGVSPTAPVIGTLAQLYPYKGLDWFIRAMPLILERYPLTTFLLAGGGPLEQELKQLATELDVMRSIRFLGTRSDILTVLEALDVYVQSSLIEAFPIAILEAAGMGLPVVASAVGGIPEAVEDGITGSLVPPRDPEALGKAILSMIDAPRQREEMGRCGRMLVEQQFNRDNMVSSIIYMYYDLLSVPAGAARSLRLPQGMAH
jgi:glycosyltransferase involved in cell wall biosynthesis